MSASAHPAADGSAAGHTPAAPLSAAEAALARAQWQATLFAAQPQRRALLALRPAWPRRAFRLRVHRNHAFEAVASALAPYLAFAGLEAQVAYSDYDDSLAFASPGPADAELLWLDYARYAPLGDGRSIARWIAGRLAALRTGSGAPILLPDAADDSAVARDFDREIRELAAAIPGVYVCDQAAVRAELGPAYFDARAADATGTRVSNAACLRTARLLGSVWLPAVLAPRLKAIALDLDHTLYTGVLGEDGAGGVRLTADDAALQRRLLELRGEGLLLALCSRNEPADVARLFETRADFPLRPEHFSALQIGWGDKAAGLRRIAEALRIAPDALLFVDDNPGELAQVASELPEAKLLYAGPTARDTRLALAWFPGLHRWSADETDVLRAADLEASRLRESLAAPGADPDAYLRSLDVRLRFTRDARSELERLAALSGKTNQFNLSLRRLSQARVAEYIESPDRTVVSIRLGDRLSDSGIVGALFTRREGDVLVVDELCISCRALGRRLEDVMITEALRCAAEGAAAVRQLRLHPVEGPRNAPALDWLRRYLGASAAADADGWVAAPWDAAAAAELVRRAPVSIEHAPAAPAAAPA